MTSDSAALTPEATDMTTRQRFNGSAFWQRASDFVVHAVLQVRVLRKPFPGVMHALIFWGMTVQIIGTIIGLMQIPLFVPFVELSFPRGAGYLAYELVMDLAGAAIMVGALMALYRRLVVRPSTLESRWDDYYALGMLLLIPALGFTLEGLRIVGTTPPWAHWSPIGYGTAALLRAIGVTPADAWNVHQSFWWVHMAAGLGLIASIPFTKMRHLITAPLNIISHPRRKTSTLEPIEDIEETELLGVGQITEFAPHQLLSLDACVRCGRCDEACPAVASGMPYSPRAFVQSLRSVMIDTLQRGNGANGSAEPGALLAELGEETPWYCTTCGACLSECPVFVNPVDEIIDLRRFQTLTTGEMPGPAAATLRNVERQGNPWGLPAADRAAWATELGVRTLEPGESTDVLLFVGCAFAYDDRNKKAFKAFIELLQAHEVDFAMLGEAEACCGDTARRLGHEYLFQMLAEQNLETLQQYEFNRIVTQCPHCLNVLKHEYAQFGGNLEVLHYTEFLAELTGAALNDAETARSNGHLMTYHDSCYLGRYNGITSEPRALLDSNGTARVEMAKQGDEAFCCGGGGGQMWLETDAETRINQRRLDQALETGADTIATACPFCLLMFDDAIRSRGLSETVQVMDIAEVLGNQLEH